MVRLNKIYTRTGDRGETGLGNGERRSKADLRVETYGTVDELNAVLGLARLHAEGEMDETLARIQNELFDLGAELATPETGEPLGFEPLKVVPSQVERMEAEIDAFNERLEPLKSFVLPAGSPLLPRSSRWPRPRCTMSIVSRTFSSSPPGSPMRMGAPTFSGCPARAVDPVFDPQPRLPAFQDRLERRNGLSLKSPYANVKDLNFGVRKVTQLRTKMAGLPCAGQPKDGMSPTPRMTPWCRKPRATQPAR